MALNPYNPYGYPQYNPVTPPINPEPKQIQYSVVNAPSVEFAQNYPVAPGNSVSFKIENQPFLCIKSMGFSPLEKPVFDTYRLVKEDMAISVEEEPKYALMDEFRALEDKVTEIEKSLKPGRRKKPEVEEEEKHE